MRNAFDMELFLAAVLTGSHSTRQRHLRQAKFIQAEIAKRWQRETPWVWHRKHVDWFLKHRSSQHSEATRYYYILTVRLLARRLGKPWFFNLRVESGLFSPHQHRPVKNGQSQLVSTDSIDGRHGPVMG